jgi:hypothetical protein
MVGRVPLLRIQIFTRSGLEIMMVFRILVLGGLFPGNELPF